MLRLHMLLIAGVAGATWPVTYLHRRYNTCTYSSYILMCVIYMYILTLHTRVSNTPLTLHVTMSAFLSAIAAACLPFTEGITLLLKEPIIYNSF